MVSKRVETKDETIYICGACRYESESKENTLKHEKRHGRDKPFETGMEVSYTVEEQGSDHGKDYTYGQKHTGRIIRFEPYDPTYPGDEQFNDGRYALVESTSGNRAWVGEYDLNEENPEANAAKKIQDEIDAQKKLLEGWDSSNDSRKSQNNWGSINSTGTFSASSDI